MAPSLKEEMENKLVQEIAKKVDQEEIPNKYLHKVAYPEAVDAPAGLWNDTLLIDVSLLSTSSDELAKLRSALSTWGFFLVKNHGMETSFLEEVIEVGKQFFSLPLEEKLKCSIKDAVFQGYGSDQPYTGNQAFHWNDRLFFTLLPEQNRKLQFWPQKPDKFRTIVDDYAKKLRELVQGIFKAMAKSLDLEEDRFLMQQGKQGNIVARFSIYPRCPCPDRVLGLRPHTDGATLTVLLPEPEVDGLQVQKDDQWFKVPLIPGTLFINLGDFAEVMTNGVFKSAMHRVVANSERDRISVAAFCVPDKSNEIGPMSELVDDQRPQQYIKFTFSEYGEKIKECSAKGRYALDALKI